MVDIMSLIDRTDEWEESIDNIREGEIKFPVKFLDSDDLLKIGSVTGKVDAPPPRLKNSVAREIKLGKARTKKDKGNKLF